MTRQHGTRIALFSALAGGSLLLVGVAAPAPAQTTEGTSPRSGWMGGMMGERSGTGMHGAGPGMMQGWTPQQMHATLPDDLRQQMDAMHDQMPANMQAWMAGPNGCHGVGGPEEDAD